MKYIKYFLKCMLSFLFWFCVPYLILILLNVKDLYLFGWIMFGGGMMYGIIDFKEAKE